MSERLGDKNFDANNLVRLKGQHGRDHIEKAWKMASAQESLMELARAYREYLKDPIHGPKDEFVDFFELSANNITPEYLESYAEQHAEFVGEGYDYDQSLSEKSIKELKKEFWTNLMRSIIGRLQEMSHRDDVDFIPNPLHANIVEQTNLASHRLLASKRESIRRKNNPESK